MIHSKISKTLLSHLIKAFSFLFVAVLFLFSSPVFADNILEIYKHFELELSREKSWSEKWMKQFKEVEKFFEFLNTKNDELKRLNLSVGAGFKGDRSGKEELYKLNIESEISKGIYPNEFRFKAGATA